MSATAEVPGRDPFEARRAAGAAGLLREFNGIGVLSAADVHVAVRLTELVGEEREAVALAAALAVRGPRLGHVFVDLATIRDTASVESDEPVDLSALAWPAVGEWLDALRASELVGGRRGGATVERRCACSAPGCTSTGTGARSARSQRT